MCLLKKLNLQTHFLFANMFCVSGSPDLVDICIFNERFDVPHLVIAITTTARGARELERKLREVLERDKIKTLDEFQLITLIVETLLEGVVLGKHGTKRIQKYCEEVEEFVIKNIDRHFPELTEERKGGAEGVEVR